MVPRPFGDQWLLSQSRRDARFAARWRLARFGRFRLLADGEIYITGRAKDVIIKGGRNLYPHEVEEMAGRVAGVRTGCVVAFGAPDARSGTEQLVVAAEVRDAAARNVSRPKLRAR